MGKQIITTSDNKIRVTQQYNTLYRAVGYMVLLTSFYLLLYPLFSGEHIVYRNQLELTFFSIPGIIVGLLAHLSKIVIFNNDTKIVIVKYITLVIPLFKRTYKLTNNTKLYLYKDQKDIPMYSHPAPNEMFSVHVVPWYIVKLVSDTHEVEVVKTKDASKSKDIATTINKFTQIPIVIKGH